MLNKAFYIFFKDWEYTPEIETFVLRAPDTFEWVGRRYFFLLSNPSVPILTVQNRAVQYFQLNTKMILSL